MIVPNFIYKNKLQANQNLLSNFSGQDNIK